MKPARAPATWLARAGRRPEPFRPGFLLLLVLPLLVACASRPVAERLENGIARLEAELASLERHGFVGQVAVAHRGETLLLAGYGTMGVEDSRPVSPQAVMPLASLTKPFTASAVLALAADRRLALDDPVGRYLEGLGDEWAGVRIEHLLTHTAGLPAEIHNRNWPGNPHFEPIDRRELVRRVNHFPPYNPPGARFRYSNVGYSLLAAVIEEVSGRAWEHDLHERLLESAGIAGIGTLEPGWSASQLVRGRAEGKDRGHYLERPRLEDGLGYNLRGAGDLLARPGAIVDWYRAVRSQAWLPSPWQRRWLTPRIEDPEEGRYGYGLSFRDSPWGPVVAHRGGDRVFASDFSWFTRPDVMVYVATASARFEADVLAPRLHELVLRGL